MASIFSAVISVDVSFPTGIFSVGGMALAGHRLWMHRDRNARVVLHRPRPFFLTGSILNVTCINMMLTQRFSLRMIRGARALSFWNYAGMNVGFFVGFAVAGYFQATESYASLFIFATLGNFVAIILAVWSWKTLVDRHSPLLEATSQQFRMRLLAGITILIGLVPVVWFLLQRPGGTERLIKGICVVVALTLIYLTVSHKDQAGRNGT